MCPLPILLTILMIPPTLAIDPHDATLQMRTVINAFFDAINGHDTVRLWHLVTEPFIAKIQQETGTSVFELFGGKTCRTHGGNFRGEKIVGYCRFDGMGNYRVVLHRSDDSPVNYKIAVFGPTRING